MSDQEDAGLAPAVKAALHETAEDLYENAPCGYLSTLPDGTIVKANRTFADLIGRSCESLISSKFQHLLVTGARIYFETHVAPLLRMQGWVNELAMELIAADGRVLPVLINVRQRYTPDGSPLVNRFTVFDAADRRRYERELLLARRKAEQVARDKADLIAMLSHDIRNPLGALTTVVQLLERGSLNGDQRRLTGILRSSSQNMLTLLDQVLELSRVESSSFALTETPFSMAAIVEDVVATFEASARQNNVMLIRSLDPALPPRLLGDPIAMRQIVTNLVSNAVKFTNSGEIRIDVAAQQVAADAVGVHVSVSDTGIGIPPEQIDRIFGEFTQATYDTKILYGGTGLGLAIVKRLLAFYGSVMDVRSVVGQGSTFSFKLSLPLPRQDGVVPSR